MTVQVERASVRTASVSIAVLKVDSRQMTKAVWNQIVSEWPFDDDGAVRGPLWGYVNYCQCGWRPSPHVHLVWQLGGELRRAVVEKPHTIGSVQMLERWDYYERCWQIALALPQVFIAA